MLVTLAVDAALWAGVGVFAPTRRSCSPLLGEIGARVARCEGRKIKRMFGEIRLPNGAHVDFWSVDHTQRAGRGRKYHLALIDEAAHDEGYLTDRLFGRDCADVARLPGSIIEATTPAGVSPDNHFWRTAHLAELGFITFHAPTSANPLLPPEEIGALRATMRRGARDRRRSTL